MIYLICLCTSSLTRAFNVLGDLGVLGELGVLGVLGDLVF
jgi:hypothetical protein